MQDSLSVEYVFRVFWDTQYNTRTFRMMWKLFFSFSDSFSVPSVSPHSLTSDVSDMDALLGSWFSSVLKNHIEQTHLKHCL